MMNGPDSILGLGQVLVCCILACCVLYFYFHSASLQPGVIKA